MKISKLGALALLMSSGAWAALPGALDPDFGSAGKGTIAIDEAAVGSVKLTGLHQVGNGDWLLTGHRKHPTLNRVETLVGRLKADGKKDTVFNAKSYKQLTPNIITTQWQAQASIFTNSQLFIAGNIVGGISTEESMLMRANGLAVKDAGFAKQGELSWKPSAGRNAQVAHLQGGSGGLWASGLLAGGSGKTHDIFLQQLTPASSAGGPAKAATVFDLKGNAIPLAHQQLSVGGVIAGSYQAQDSSGLASGSKDMLLIQYDASGKLNLGFNQTGWRRIGFNGVDAEAQAVLRLSNGKLLVMGCRNDNGAKFTLALVNSNGALATEFAAQGRFFGSSAGCAIAAKQLPDSSIWVVADQGQYLAFHRFSAKGEVLDSRSTAPSSSGGSGSGDVVDNIDNKKAGAGSAQSLAPRLQDVMYAANSGTSLPLSTTASNVANINANKYALWQDDGLVVASVSGSALVVTRYLFNDDDQDEVLNSKDNCRFDANPQQEDLDEDGIGDVCDADRDGDSHPNDQDAFPDDPAEWLDTDGDGIGDEADTDDDNDGIPDEDDLFPRDPYLLNHHPDAAKGAQAGSKVLLVSDFNGDNIGDFLVSEPTANVQLNGKLLKKAGRVVLRSGGGLDELYVFEGKQANEQFGQSLALWPVAGEALPRIVIGAPQVLLTDSISNKKLKKAGLVRVYQAQNTDSLQFGETEIAAATPTANGQFGAALAANAEHLLIGAPFEAAVDSVSNKPLKQAGAVYRVNVDYTVQLLRQGSTAKEKFGTSVALGAGDMWAAGAPGRTAIQPLTNKKIKNAGGIVVHDEQGERWLDGLASNDQLGGVLLADSANNALWAGVPKADVVIGKKRLIDAGQVWLIDHASESLSYTSVQADIPVAKQYFGQSVAVGGELLVVGSPQAKVGKLAKAGRIDLFSCDETDCAFIIGRDGRTSQENFGASVDASNDLNQDGVADIIVGSPGANKKAGRADIFSGKALLRIQ